MVSDYLIDNLRRIKSDDILLIWKRNFNAMLDKANKADAYMNETSISNQEKEIQLMKYYIEIVEPLSSYVEVFMRLGISLPNDVLQGFPEAR